MKTIILLIIFSSTGCATSDRFRTTMHSWNEETIPHLKSKWGEPVKIINRENDRVYVYELKKFSTQCEAQFLAHGEQIKGWRSSGVCSFTEKESSKYFAESATWNSATSAEHERQENAMSNAAKSGAVTGAAASKLLGVGK